MRGPKDVDMILDCNAVLTSAEKERRKGNWKVDRLRQCLKTTTTKSHTVLKKASAPVWESLSQCPPQKSLSLSLRR